MTKEPKPKIVATYDYSDANGKLLYQVCRMEPKDFRVRRPGQKKDWIWNLQGVQKVLYKLHKINAASSEETIYKVEGEKDADRVEKEGKVATTNPGGANKWQTEYSEQLRGRPVVIIPDNDEAGRKHAEKVAMALHGVATSIKVVHLPELPPKGDVSDWLDAENTIGELEELVQSTPDWVPPADKQKTPKPKKEKNQKDKPVFSAHFEGLVDLAWHEGGVVFLIKDGNGITIKRAVLRNGATLVPPPPDQIKWLMPRADKVIQSYEAWQLDPVTANTDLWNTLMAYHQGLSDLPDERLYALLVSWDIHTYLQEFSQYSPEIVLFAVAERGKTRTGKGLTYVAYRGVRVTSMREAFIFRMAENLRATLFFDLRDAWKETQRNGCDDIILNRFERGSMVPRVLWPDKGDFRDTKYYDVFGPTIIATNRALDSILETRAITTTMRESSKVFRGEVQEKDAQSLREKLLALRAHYLDKPLPDAEKPVSGRLGDITRPLRQIITAIQPSREEEFLALCRDLKKGIARDRADTVEGQVVAVIRQLEREVVGGKLPIKLITNTVNEDKQDRFKLSPQSIGRIVKALGFYDGPHRPKTDDGAAAIPWNDVLLDRLEVEYGIADTSETPETSDGPSNTEQTEVSEGQSEVVTSKQAPCSHTAWSPLGGTLYQCNHCLVYWNLIEDKEEATL